MNNTLKVAKYQVYDFRKAVAIFYSIIISLLIVIVGINTIEGPGKATMGGLEIVTAIFIFVAGLNCFKSTFKFMLANNISRKRFYYGNIIALAVVSGFMALIDSVLNQFLRLIITYESAIFQLYNKTSFIDGFLWLFGLYMFSACLGWLIRMINYRSNSIMKIVISIIPIPIILLFQYIEQETGGVIGRTIIDFLDKALGFAYNNNLYIGALSFAVGSGVLLLICFLLVRKAIIKD